jgi:hypothetical protein
MPHALQSTEPVERSFRHRGVLEVAQLSQVVVASEEEEEWRW